MHKEGIKKFNIEQRLKNAGAPQSVQEGGGPISDLTFINKKTLEYDPVMEKSFDELVQRYFSYQRTSNSKFNRKTKKT